MTCQECSAEFSLRSRPIGEVLRSTDFSLSVSVRKAICCSSIGDSLAGNPRHPWPPPFVNWKWEGKLTAGAGGDLDLVGGAAASFEVSSASHAAGETLLGFGGWSAFDTFDDAAHAFTSHAGESNGDFVAEEGFEYGFVREWRERLILKFHNYFQVPWQKFDQSSRGRWGLVRRSGWRRRRRRFQGLPVA